MSDSRDIPVLTDLIESGPEITLSDLGLDQDPVIAAEEPAAGLSQAEEMTIDIDEAAAVSVATSEISPVLEQVVRRILDEHMELAWQEIKLAIEQYQNR